ncbi:RecQ family ATP-dependent DNA helicase [Domibacillus sp. PGB-M46]|uniref:RecQ family ATP-dependent DNA helicase n=1 Tax=Domibacillus sp. PGB-M46 TaxID=2910255 RepID=UPI001F580A40|nr:RecQ family ATP-dependent DNA helicase [Domibacillus sp. PGB-M46]MCI2254217.1 RecQ family ATP-dependent DNA helicase [Domibacillus sp. PGB-M46]
MQLEEVFKEYFPQMAKEIKLKEIQKKVIENVLGVNNTLAILPTGGGKSLIYWLSGMALRGITIVVSPLIALIDEQAEKLSEQNISVLKLHSDVKQKEQIELLSKLYNGEYTPSFIFVSPERLAMDGLLEKALKNRKEDIKLIVIDEIHCISQWGESFRPLYTHIPTFLNTVFDKWPVVLGLSATLNVLEVEDIKKSFYINDKNVIKDVQLMRTEINLICKHFNDEDEKEETFWNLLELHKNEKTLVYVYRKYSKRGVEDFSEKAKEKGIKSVYFHADLSSNEKQNIIRKYKNNEIDLIFATNAFGMGIDIPDIKLVIHFMIPESIAQYYQEVGRASRNKETSNAYLLYTDKNVQIKKTHFINKSFPSYEKIEEKFEEIRDGKTGFRNIEYYNDDTLQLCLPYLLDVGAVKICAKAIHSLKILENIKNTDLQLALEASKPKTFITTLKKTDYTPEELSDLVFESLLKGECSVKRSLAKCLIVEVLVDDLKPFEQRINEMIKEKKKFKYDQLDYFVYTIDRTENSVELHQEIAQFLGVSKWDLNKIYATEKGDKVRSKSEVVIANTLFNKNIPYEYEKTLLLSNGKQMSPDFTIQLSGKTYFLEHIGMLNNEQYSERWLEKRKLYDKFYKENLLITYESPNLATDALNLIKKFIGN